MRSSRNAFPLRWEITLPRAPRKLHQRTETTQSFSRKEALSYLLPVCFYSSKFTFPKTEVTPRRVLLAVQSHRSRSESRLAGLMLPSSVAALETTLTQFHPSAANW